jgi:hypothetical protein
MLTFSRSSIVDTLLKSGSEDPSFGLAYFYCDGTSNLSAKIETRFILGSILRQLLESSDTKNLSIEPLQRFQKESRSYTNSRLVKLLVDAIFQFSKSFREVYIIVDGIDECVSCTDLYNSLLTLADANIKVLVISRPERNIEEAFSRHERLEFTENFSHADISTHIDWSFEQDKRLKMIKPELQNEIKLQLLKKSDGM